MLQRYATSLAVTLAVLLVAIAAAASSANRLSASESSFRVMWGGATEKLRVHAQGLTIECDVTLTGSFTTRTFIKVRGSRIASIYQARRENCAPAALYTILVETLPWPVNYEGFVGTLPRITRIDATMVGAGILYKYSLIFREFLCLALFTAASPWLVRIALESGPRVTTWSTPTSTAPGSFECTNLSLEGTGAAVTAASGSELRLTLI